MFRRRTDQVYSTLQQVQRRITEQGGPTPMVRPTPPQPIVPLGDVRAEGEPPQASPLFASQPGPPAHPAPLPHAAVNPAHPGQAPLIAISLTTVITLLLMLVASWVAIYLLGYHQGQRSSGTGVQTPVTPPTTPIIIADPPRAEVGYWLISSKANPAARDRSEWERSASAYNAWITKLGLRPLFAAVVADSGQLQLVYGYENGRGIARRDTDRVLDELRKPAAQNGPGLNPTWVAIKP